MFDGNRVTAHTRSRYPIFQSPMTWIARAPLVSAVSAAGAMGLLENSIRDLSVTQREFLAIRAATNQPFGVNLPVRYLQMDPKEESAIIDWLLSQGIHFVTTSAGDPTRYTKMLKDAGVIVYHATATLRGAIKAVDAGVDGLIVEGAESAGLRNPEEVHTFALLQAVREKVDVPIVAAGGIVDGRGMAAAFALGAEGVTMGTRFVASFESPVHLNYKQAIVDAFNGGDGGQRARIGSTIYASRFYASISVLSPAVSILSLLLGSATPSAASLAVPINRRPTVTANDISVTLI